MDHRNDHRDRVLRLEADRHITTDHQQRKEDCEGSAPRDLSAEGRPYGRVVEGRNSVGLVQNRLYLGRLTRREIRLDLETVLTEVLRGDLRDLCLTGVGYSSRGQTRTNLLDRCRLLQSYRHAAAGFEVEAEVELADRKRDATDQKDHP